MIAGMSNACCGLRVIRISLVKGNSVKIDVLVAHSKPLGFGLPLGIDVIKVLVGIIVGSTGSVQIGDGKVNVCAPISINVLDVTTSFNHQSLAWTAAWKCSEN